MTTCSSAGVGGGSGDVGGPGLALAQLPGHGSPPATLGTLQVRSSRVLHVYIWIICTLYTCVCRYCTLCTCLPPDQDLSVLSWLSRWLYRGRGHTGYTDQSEVIIVVT